MQPALDKNDLFFLPLRVLKVSDSENGHVHAPERFTEDVILEVPPSPPARPGHVWVIRVKVILLLHLLISLFLHPFIFKGVSLLRHDSLDILSKHGVGVGDGVSKPDLIIVAFESETET